MNKFDRNQYQLLLKRFDKLRQKDSVEEYQLEFEKLASFCCTMMLMMILTL